MSKRERQPSQHHVEIPDQPDKVAGSPREREAPQKNPELEQAKERFAEFSETFEPLINGYFGTESIQFQMKDPGWYIDLENIKVNADPTFFMEKGFSESEALFATFHEAEHFRDMAEDHDSYRRLFRRFKREARKEPAYGQALQKLYNCLDDVLVNRAVMSRWKAGTKAKDAVYPKLFPQADLRGDPEHPQPRHRQLMYGILREAMLPDEEIEVDPEVREAIDAWQARGGNRKAIDLLTSVDRNGTAAFKGQKRFEVIQQTIEPVFRNLFLKDLEDRKKQQRPDQGDSQQGKEKDDQESQPGNDPFEPDPFEDAIPDPIDYEDILDKIKDINEALSKKREQEYEEVMGVSKEDFAAYRRDYDKVAPYVQELSEVFDQIIQQRISTRRVLRKPVKEGPMLDPRKAAIAAAEVRAGKTDPTVFLDYREQEVVREQPDQIEFTLVCDGSGSMTDGRKDAMQRQIAVMVTEAFADFQERIAKKVRSGQKLKLNIQSEIRIFSDSDQEIKALSSQLTHEDRVRMHKSLRDLPGGGNNEPATFEAIEDSQFNKERVRKLREGELKKVILFLTDGVTDDRAVQAEIKKLKKMAGATKKGASNLVIAGIGFEGGKSAVQTYAPNGQYAKNLQELPAQVENFIKSILEDV